MKYLFLTTIICLTFFTFGNSQKSDELIVPLTNPGQVGMLEIDLRSGSIEVVGKDRSDILVRYTLQEKKDSPEAGKSGLKKYKSNALDLDISENDNFVRINSDSWNNGPDVYVEIPKNFNAHLDSYMGHEIKLSGVKGEISLEAYTGDVFAHDISGFVSASSYSGSIKIEVDELSSDKPMAFSTYSGNIDLTFPTSFSSNLKIQTKWGDVYSSYDLKVDESKPMLKKDEDSKNFKLVSESWMYATVNGGGPETMIKSTSGNIYLRSPK